ncbi:GSCOCG00008434001-RA-CDS [Cotesia congregata]|nr:GSCOCG00008434001-RA-CDS [Cotesia congregata]
MDTLKYEEDFKLLNQNFHLIKQLQKSQKNNENESDDSKSDQINKLIEESIYKIEEIKVLEDQNVLLLGMKTTLLYERSKLLTNLNQHQDAEELLAQCLKDINDFITSKELIYLSLRIINHYAYLLSKREDYTEARKILELGEKVYETADIKNGFWSSDDLFAGTLLATTNATSRLEHLVTNNLQMLAFVYSKMELHDKFAEYHHRVLDRQLLLDDKEPLVWSFKSTTLAAYLSANNRFEEAKNHLEAAEFVLKKYEDELKALELSKEVSDKLKSVQEKLMIVAKGWVKYSLSLFNASISKMVEHLSQDLSPTEALEQTNLLSPPCEDIIKEINEEENTGEDDNKLSSETKLLFKLNVDSQVSTTLVENTCEARILFNYSHNYLTKIRMFYTLESNPMDYVNAILDLSELYRCLAFYEEEIESQYSVQKLRADAIETLSTILRQVRPECYIAVSIELLQELAEIQLDLLGLNLRRIYAARDNIEDSQRRKVESLKHLHSKIQKFKNDSNDSCSSVL